MMFLRAKYMTVWTVFMFILILSVDFVCAFATSKYRYCLLYVGCPEATKYCLSIFIFISS